MVQALTLLSAQRFPDIDGHRFARLRPQTSLLGGIRPSRSSVVSARCVNPRLQFRNGLVKMRYRGRVVKYVCRPGYSLFGDSVSTCHNGHWDRPVPICAAPGCRLPSDNLLPRGVVENVRGRGLMLRFGCRLGYTLRGGATAFCDGRSWNGSRPSCVPTVADPDLSCDFEALDQCGWTSDLSSGVQFSRQHESHVEEDVAAAADNGTASVAAPPSPSGHYMALESVGHRLALPDLGLPARLVSPPYRPLRFRACFRFWYRLSCSLCTLQVLVWNSTNLAPLWNSYGPRKAGWANVEVPKSLEDFQLVFSARTRQPGEGGVAIDDVRLGPECQDVPTAEPPPATTTLLPDDVTTELDSGDTWETTTTDVGISVGKEEVSKSDTDAVSTEKIPVATSPGQRSSVKPMQTTRSRELATHTYSPQTTELPMSSSVATPQASSSAAPPQTSPPTITHSAGTTNVPTTGPVTSFLTHSAVTTYTPARPSHKPSLASTYDAKSTTSSWLKTESPITERPAMTDRQSSIAPRPSATAAGTTFHPTATTPFFVATRSKPTSEATSTTQSSMTRGPYATTFNLRRLTTGAGAYPSVEGNTVGPEVPPAKVTASRTSTASSAATQTPTRRSFTHSMTEAIKRTTVGFHTTEATFPSAPRITTATKITGYRSTAFTWKASTGLPTKGSAVTASTVFEVTATVPITKPTKPKKKATEMHTKPPKWTRKPGKESEDGSTVPPLVSSSHLPLSSQPVPAKTTLTLPTPRYPHRSQSSSHAPKFVPTEESNLLNSHLKTSRPPLSSGNGSKNDEDNEVMQSDDAGIAGLQEKHSAAAPSGGSSWTLPALLIAAGVILVAIATATALYRCRRIYRGSVDDSEMKPLSKYADGDPADMSS